MSAVQGFYTKDGKKRPITEKKGRFGRRRYKVPEKVKEEEKKVEKEEEKLDEDKEKLDKEEVKDERKEEKKGERREDDPSGPIKIEHPGSLEGWEHGQDEETRHNHIKESYKVNGKAETEKKLAALEVLDQNRAPEVARAAHQDLEWFKRDYPT